MPEGRLEKTRKAYEQDETLAPITFKGKPFIFDKPGIEVLPSELTFTKDRDPGDEIEGHAV